MDGLECSEIGFSELNKEWRIDAEYFLKDNLKMQSEIISRPYFTIGQIATVTDGIHTSIDYDDDSKSSMSC